MRQLTHVHLSENANTNLNSPCTDLNIQVQKNHQHQHHQQQTQQSSLCTPRRFHTVQLNLENANANNTGPKNQDINVENSNEKNDNRRKSNNNNNNSFATSTPVRSDRSYRSAKLSNCSARNSLNFSNQSFESSFQTPSSDTFSDLDFPALNMVSGGSGSGNHLRNYHRQQTLTINNSVTGGVGKSAVWPVTARSPANIEIRNNHSRKKKRVAPIKVANSTLTKSGSLSTSIDIENFGDFPAFKNENNLIGISQEDDPIMCRTTLKHHIDEISKDILTKTIPSPKVIAHRTTTTSAFCGNVDQTNVPPPIQQLQPPPLPLPPSSKQQIIDLAKVTNLELIKNLSDIYSILIDMNLTINILSELSYLLNLLNTNYYESIKNEETKDDGTDLEVIFSNGSNCVYFSIGVLNKQLNLLVLMDLKTIQVFLENDRLTKFCPIIKKCLTKLYIKKVKFNSMPSSSTVAIIGDSVTGSIDTVGGADTSCTTETRNKIVSYQEDDDTRQNFPSSREFGAFNKQRDLFYNILRIWESKHYTRSWSFQSELAPKIRSLIAISDHPINMAHLAKLFISQLILSCSFNTAMPDLQQALPNADASKIAKLNQRLIAPSQYSTDFLFPGVQSFFKDFVKLAEFSCIFTEQLKMLLINELIEMTNSSYDTLNLMETNCPDDEAISQKKYKELLVRPEAINVMRVLAKFLGFLLTRPYNGYDCSAEMRNLTVDNHQIQIRNLMCQPFDIKSILLKSIVDKKILILLPWLVQFLSMLDYVTLQLEYYKDIFNILYELYILSSENRLAMHPTSLFIIRSGLGWLFDQSNVPDQYFEYRRIRSAQPLLSGIIETTNNLQTIQLLVPKPLSNYFGNNNVNCGGYQVISQYTISVKNNETEPFTKINCTIEKYSPESKKMDSTTITTAAESSITQYQQYPILEKFLNSACPYLADFRVSIMPSKHAKTVSRTTGRYRHITTKLTENQQNDKKPKILTATTSTPLTTTTTTINTVELNVKAKLTEAFLQSQSLSVRRTFEFVIERTVSAVIKDFQVEYLVPIKKSVYEKMLQLCPPATAVSNPPSSLASNSNATSNTATSPTAAKLKKKFVQNIHDCYSIGFKEILEQWSKVIPNWIETRIEKSFNSLFPREMLPAVEEICINLARQTCTVKTNEWKESHLKKTDFFPPDIYQEAMKLIKGSLTNSLLKTQILNVKATTATEIPATSHIFSELQIQLHLASMKPEMVNEIQIKQLINNLKISFMVNNLSNNMYHTGAFMILQLLLLIVCKRYDMVNKSFINVFTEFWKCEKLKNMITPPKTSISTASSSSSSSSSEDNDIDNDGYNRNIDNADNDDLSNKDANVKLSEIVKITTNKRRQRRDRKTQQNKNESESIYLFRHLISPHYLRNLMYCSEKSFIALELVIIELLREHLLTMHQLNDECVLLFREEWDKNILTHLSKMLQNVVDNLPLTVKKPNNSSLFLEMLSDLTRSIDDVYY